MAGVISRASMAGAGVISGSSPCTAMPFATSVRTLFTVSSVRVEPTCSFLVAFIAVVARRNRFSIFSPASYTSCDRMIYLNSRYAAFSAEAWIVSAQRLSRSISKRSRQDGCRGRRGGRKFLGYWIVDRLYVQHTLPQPDSLICASETIPRTWRRVKEQMKGNYDRGYAINL